MTFKIIDTAIGREPSSQTLKELAKQGKLFDMDIDQFYVGEDGTLILMDDCGNYVECDRERFKIDDK